MGKAKYADDFVSFLFGGGRALVKNGDEFAGLATVFTKTKFDPMAFFDGMGRGSYFKNLDLPEIPLKTSKLFDTAGHLNSLSKVDLKSLVPKSTDEIASSFAKKADDLDFKSATKRTESAQTTAELSTKGLDNVLDKQTFDKLDNIADDFTSFTGKNSDDIAKIATKEMTESLDKVSDFKNLSNMTDMTKSLKKTSGFTNAANKNADSFIDVSVTAVAKKGDGFYDDVAEQVTDGPILRNLKKIKKYDGTINMTIIASYYFSLHVRGEAPWSDSDIYNSLDDPVVPDEFDRIQYEIDVADIVQTVFAENRAKEYQANALTVIAVLATIRFLYK